MRTELLTTQNKKAGLYAPLFAFFEEVPFVKKRIIGFLVFVLALGVALSLIIFDDFIFAKNEIFPKTGESIYLTHIGAKDSVINTDNPFKVRRVQNFLEKTEKVETVLEEPEEEQGPIVLRGAKHCNGGIALDGKIYSIEIDNNILVTQGKAYEITDKDFYDKLKILIKEIGNQYQ